MATKKPNKLEFETAISELETIVKTIEQGGIGLEESLNLFTKGVALTKECQKTLKEAEQKVQILTNGQLQDFKDGSLTT